MITMLLMTMDDNHAPKEVIRGLGSDISEYSVFFILRKLLCVLDTYTSTGLPRSGKSQEKTTFFQVQRKAREFWKSQRNS